MELESIDLTKRVIGSAFRVANSLGCGFLEKVYENALAMELRSVGLAVVQQAPLQVLYRGEIVGAYYADICVEQELLIEVKAVRRLDAIHEAQCINYMKASGIRLTLLLNFARPRLELRRLVRSSDPA